MKSALNSIFSEAFALDVKENKNQSSRVNTAPPT